ncbi:MAG: phosphoribosylanthranilate isomerase [Haliscomenobacter sp.]
MKKYLIKVCGMRSPENIREIAALPIDWMGFIFYPESPRFVADESLSEWMNHPTQGLPAHIKRVGVFVNAPMEEVMNYTHDYQLDYVQLHGGEPPEYCRELLGLWDLASLHKAKIIKAFSVDAAFDFSAVDAYADVCSYALFDTKTSTHGGSGVAFDWAALDNYTGSLPFFLSGGIQPEMVGEIRALQHPALAGMDINSRFETRPGWKNPDLVAGFVNDLNQ